MKYLIFFFILILTGNVGFSQVFTVTELENLSQKNLDDFDTYVNKKGYSFDSDNIGPMAQSKAYAYKPNGNSKAEKWITLNQYYDADEETKSSITWQTGNQSEYVSFKNQIKLAGYKFDETGTYDEAIFFKYKKGKRSISIFISKEENGREEKTTVYEISLINNR